MKKNTPQDTTDRTSEIFAGTRRAHPNTAAYVNNPKAVHVTQRVIVVPVSRIPLPMVINVAVRIGVRNSTPNHMR
jgi:hypothetical protein